MNTKKPALGGRFTFPGTAMTVRRLGYGAMQLAGPHAFGPPRDVRAAVAVLREAVGSGVNHIDTADAYGPHVTNQIIKQALHPYPSDLVVATKVGARRGEDKSWIPASSPGELTAQVHDNLENLGKDALDLVNLRCGTPTGPREESIAERVEVMIELKRRGLVQRIGLSNVTPAQYRQARSLTEIVCVQNMYNLQSRADDALVAELATAGVAYVPFFPLGGFSPLRSSALSEVASQVRATPFQVALAWLLQRSPNILPIPGTSSVAHLRQNLAAADLTLSAEMVARLEEKG